MPPIAFRPATAADAPAVVRIVNAAYRLGGGRAWTSEKDLVEGPRITPEGFLDLVTDPNGLVLLGERGGSVVGCVHLERAGTDCHLGMLSVDPAAQAEGIGRTILEAAEAHARGMGSDRTIIEVLSNRAELVAWYERRGYRKTGTAAPFEKANERTLAGPLTFASYAKPLRGAPSSPSSSRDRPI